jgi:colanic acid biosynthesis glycosyl transferase WcaI
VRTHPAWRLWYYFTFAVSSFLNGLLLGRQDTVLSISTPLFGGWTAWLLARLTGARIVYAIFDLHPESAANAGLLRKGTAYRLLRWLDTLLCRWSDSVITLGEGMKEAIVARGVDPGRIHVIPLWVDGRKIPTLPRDNGWRRRHGITPGTFVALYAGTIGHISGAEILVETAELLRGEPDILILCVGEGPVKARLEEQTARVGLSNVRFLPFQPAAALGEMQATADVGLVTLLPDSGKTSVPSKVLGYMAAGRPIIAAVATDSDTARMIREGACGRITAPLDPAELAGAILAFARDRDQGVELGRRARLHFERFFDRGPCAQRYEAELSGREAAARAGV